MIRRVLLLAAAVLIAFTPQTAWGQEGRPAVSVTPELIAEFREDPEAFFFDLRHLEAIACASQLINDPEAEPDTKAQAFRILGQVYAAMDAPEQARAAFTELFSLEPHAELDPPAAYPPMVVRAFYSVRDELAAEAAGPLTAAPAGAGGIHTLAIGPMDNQSPDIPGGKFDLDRFAAGLTQIITSDLMPATSLRIVDRQRLDVLRSEIQISNSGFADPDQAVKAGRLLGAQSYLFGSLIMLPNGLVRIDLRLVETETGAVLLAEARERKVEDGADLLKLESDIVLLLAKKLDSVTTAAGASGESVSKPAKAALSARKKASDRALAIVDRTGAAILAEDSGRIDDALGYWTEVSRLDPGNGLAATRITALETGRKYAALDPGQR